MSNRNKDLTPEQNRICWLKGTEAPFTGEHLNNKEVGSYCCVNCGERLFSSEHKYDSGSGWPSYFQPYAAGAVSQVGDDSHGMDRIEVTCGNCGAHLGHIFNDGPKPTGVRYCINSAALKFLKKN